MNKPLRIPTSKKFKGLFVHCSACDALVTDQCKKHNQPIEKCKEGKTRFKAIIHVPGTKKQTRSLILDTRDYNEAVKQTLAFKAKIHEGDSTEKTQPVSQTPQQASHEIPAIERRPMLLDLLALHVGVLHDDPELVPEFKKKNLSAAYVADCERTYTRFMTALKKANCNAEHLTPSDVNDQLVGIFYKYLQTDLQLGNAGFNRAITNMVSFFNYLIDEGHAAKNPFHGVTRKATKQNVDTIEEADFRELIAQMHKPELGMHTYANGIRKNMWRVYLPEAVELILYTGRRRTECTLMKWEDIQYEDNRAICIRVPDYKVNKAKKLSEEQWRYHYVPVNDELRNLLLRMGEANYRGSSAYIIAPEEQTLSREGIASLLSKAFNHYYELLHPDKETTLSLGCLRRTNFSQLSAAIGIENAQAISGHSRSATLKRFYVSKKVLAQAAEYNVFDEKDKDSREERLKKSRGRDRGMSRSRE